jgi:hypothetical protein
MTTREAKCTCGALSATATGDPIRNSVCHCLDCKRRTGSAFSWNAHWPGERVEISGEAATATRSSEEGFWCRYHFCPACGVTVWYEIERRPGVISIPVGAFADPDFPPPTVEVYAERRCAWLGDFATNREG